MTDETSNTNCAQCHAYSLQVKQLTEENRQLQTHVDRVLAREVALAEAHNALARNHIGLLRAHGRLQALCAERVQMTNPADEDIKRRQQVAEEIASNNDINATANATPSGADSVQAARPADGTRDGAGTWLDGQWHPDCMQPLQPPIEDGDGGIHFLDSADQPDWQCNRADCDIAIPHEHLSHAQVRARQLSAAARMANTFADSEQPRPNSRVLPPDQLPASMQPPATIRTSTNNNMRPLSTDEAAEMIQAGQSHRVLLSAGQAKEPQTINEVLDRLDASDETANTPHPDTEAR